MNKSLIFAGGIRENGNHKRIISAVRELSDVEYTLCGFGKQSDIDRLKLLDGWDKVNFKGKIPPEHVHRELLKSRVGIIVISEDVTTGYGMGTLGSTKIFEYMRAGLPVICTNFKLWQDIIKKHKCGICVDPCDEKELYLAIKLLMDNYEIANEMGKKGKIAVYEEYNWSSQESLLLNIYHTLKVNT